MAARRREPSIYLHSTWRCASTYVWAKFRDHPDHYGYFEPLNEHLAEADMDFIDRFRPWAYANHPALTTPYLEEFRPLLAARGGIDGFPADLSFGRYRLERTEQVPALKRYFERLERFAHDLGQTPVFGCVRTDLRVGWFRDNLPGAHIVLRRDPRRQFLSCLAQAAKGNPYFLQRGLVILASNREDPAFGPVKDLVDEGAIGDALRQPLARSLDRTPDLSDLYVISYALHRLAQVETRRAHLVLDMDLIGAEPDAAQAAEAAIFELTGTCVSFADCRIERYERLLERATPMFEAIEAKVDSRLSERRDAA